MIEVYFELLWARIFEIRLQIPQSLKVDVCGPYMSLDMRLSTFDLVYAPPDAEHNLFSVYVGFRDASCIHTFTSPAGTTVHVRVGNLLLILGEWVLKPRVGALQRVDRK